MPSFNSAPNERLVTANDIADLLSVNPKWVYSACRLYDMPFYQVGRYKRFSPSQVVEWLDHSGIGAPAASTSNR